MFRDGMQKEEKSVGFSCAKNLRENDRKKRKNKDKRNLKNNETEE